MEKAAKAVKRGSARLRSLGSGHGDLSVCISEQRDVKNAAKAFINAQQSATEYQLKWAAGRNNNKAVLDVANQVWELNCHWAEVQQHFVDKLREYQKMFELMLEGERAVDLDRTSLTALTEKHQKYEKELKKAIKRGYSTDDLEEMKNKLAKVESQKERAEVELSEKITENEAVKLIRFRGGLCKLSEAYTALGKRCQTIFEAQRELAQLLPDMSTVEHLGDVKYRGAIQAREIVRDAIQDTQVEPPSGRRRSSQGQKRRSGAIEHQLEKQGDLSPLVSQSEPQTDVKKRGSAPPDLDDLPPPYSPPPNNNPGHSDCSRQFLSERRCTFPLAPLSDVTSVSNPRLSSGNQTSDPVRQDINTGYTADHAHTGYQANRVAGSEMYTVITNSIPQSTQRSHLYPNLKELFPEEEKKAIPTDMVEVPVNSNITQRSRVTKFV